MKKEKVSRRNFIRWGLLWGAGAALAGCGLLSSGQEEISKKEDKLPPEKKVQEDEGKLPDKDREPEKEKEGSREKDQYPVPRRKLGKTGEYVSILGLGGAIAVARERDKAVEIVNEALDLGINYIDTAASYGSSEGNIGEVMRHRRGEAFLAGKTDDRTYDGTMRLFERSLKRLQTDYLDLYQLHGVHSAGELQEILNDGGAIKALEELQDSGAIRYTGITAHKNASFFKTALEEYPFDCALISLNAGDVYHDSMIREVLPAAQWKNMGVIAMKVASYDGRIFREGGLETMEQALGYVLSYPVSTAIVGVASVSQLRENVNIARAFKPFTDREMKEGEELTRPYQEEVNFFKHQW